MTANLIVSYNSYLTTYVLVCHLFSHLTILQTCTVAKLIVYLPLSDCWSLTISLQYYVVPMHVYVREYQTKIKTSLFQ